MSATFMIAKPDMEVLTGRLNRAAGTVSRNTGRTTTELALELLDELVQSTPVDSGRARTGWFISESESASGPDSPEGPYPDAAAVPARESSGLSGLSSGRAVFIINRVEYIVGLEMGRSGQAPSGMVRSALAALPGRAGALFRRSGERL